MNDTDKEIKVSIKTYILGISICTIITALFYIFFNIVI